MKLTLPWSSASDTRPMDGLVQRTKIMDYDQPLVWVVLLLMLMGIVMVYSASISLPDSPKYASYKTNHFLIRQSMFVAVSILAGLVVFGLTIPVRHYPGRGPLVGRLHHRQKHLGRRR